ncbi:Transposase type 1 [Trinorchestia longiramus]|nr:Transposase type 1 [Trinorchestia longiramus]
MKETYFDFEKLDLNPRIISAAKQNGLLSIEGVLYGCSRHYQAGRQLPHADHRQLVAAVSALYCPVRLTGIMVAAALDLLQQEQKSSSTFSFGCPKLDGAVGDVLLGGSVLEVCGESGVGKTQLALSIAVNAVRPTSQGGRGATNESSVRPLVGQQRYSKVVASNSFTMAEIAYVCTEGQFPSSRLRQITESVAGPLQHDAIASRMFVQHVEDLGALVTCVEHQLPAVVAKHQLQVVVVDSVAAPLRGAEQLRWTDRQTTLNRLGYGLRRLAAASSCLVLAINQVSARIERKADLYGLGAECEVLPALGLAWSNLVTSRLLLRRAPPDAPLLGEGSGFEGSNPHAALKISLPVSQGPEADSMGVLGEAPGERTTFSNSCVGYWRAATNPGDQGNFSRPSCLHRSCASEGRQSDGTCTDGTSSALHKYCSCMKSHCGGGETYASDRDCEGRNCAKRARVVGASKLAHESGLASPRVAISNAAPIAGDTGGPQRSTRMEASAGDVVLRAAPALEGPPPSSVRTLQVVACPSGRNETEDDPRSGRPCTSVCVENIDAVRDLIEKDRRITTESVADTLNIFVGFAHTILVDSLGLSKLSARWVPRLLRPDQQESRADLSMEILNKWDENPELFLQQIVTGDETWLYQYDPVDKTQSKQWLPRSGSGPVKAKFERSRGKVMPIVFWDAEGILLVDFLENKKIITAVYYEEILRKLSKKIAEKRPGKLLRRVLFHHDNARAHGARQTRPELCYANFDGKSFDIHLIAPT